MALNSLGREIPEVFAGKKQIPYGDPWSLQPRAERSTRAIRRDASASSTEPISRVRPTKPGRVAARFPIARLRSPVNPAIPAPNAASRLPFPPTPTPPLPSATHRAQASSAKLAGKARNSATS